MFLERIRQNWDTRIQAFTPRRTAMRWVPITIIALLLLVGSGAGVAYASEGALPGDTLYSAKTAIEGVRLAFSDSDGDVELYNQFANERVEEMQALLAAGRPDDLPAAVQGYENALNGMAQALAAVASDDAARGDALADLITAAHEKRTQVLTDLLSKVPEGGQKGIQRALEAPGPPEGKGKPDDTGKPENPGCPENAGGPPEGKGKPDDVGGPPEDAGPPEDSDAPDGAGPPDHAGGPPEGKGKPEDAGPPEGCASENHPDPEGGDDDEGDED